MRKTYNFSNAVKGAVLSAKGKTRITIMLDDDLLVFFRSQAESQGVGYQTLINTVLRQELQKPSSKKKETKPLTVAALRKVIREELNAV
jgi:hypothetical protein